MKRILVVSSAALLVLVGTFFAYKADALVIRWGNESSNLEPYSITDDDLYMFNDRVVVNGTVNGDVFAGGSNVTQMGTTTEDVLLVGGVVTLDGKIDGDARVAGGKVFVDGHIKEDAVLVGGTVTINEDAVIDGDVFVYAEHLVLEGTVNGVGSIHARTVEIKGILNNHADIEAFESLSVTGDAYIRNDLMYTAPREAFISDTATIGGKAVFTVDNKQPSTNNTSRPVSIVFWALISVVASVGLLLFFPAQTQRMVQIGLSNNAGVQLLKAIFLLFVIPIVAFLISLTIIGIVPGFLIFSFYGVTLFTSMALAPVFSGVLLARSLKKNTEELTLTWTMYGAVLFSLLVYVPVVGWLMRILLFLLAFYAVLVLFYDVLWKKRKEISYEVLPKSTQEHDKKEDSKPEEQEGKTE